MNIDNNLIGEVVNNCGNGRGKITKIEGNYIYIRHDNGANIQYRTDAFVKGFLTFENQELQTQIDEEIKRLNEEERARREAEAEERARREAENRAREERERLEAQNRINTRRRNHQNTNNGHDGNILYRTQICDGGTTDYSNWFRGPCSRELREHHTQIDDTCCRYQDSICRQVVNGQTPLNDIQNSFENCNLCYESRMLLDHVAKAGWSRINNRNTPNTWNGVRDNKLVVLITKEPNRRQEDYIIYSVFLSSNTFRGSNIAEGSTQAAANYFIDLTIEEARQMRLRDYISVERINNWHHNLFHYIDDLTSARILRNMVEIVGNRNDENNTRNAEEFLNHFLQLIGKTIEDLDE